jgi:ABC-type antimicrobial peptide transport system permease subunit
VVETARRVGLVEDEALEYYQIAPPEALTDVDALVVRAAGHVPTVAAAVRRAVAEVEPALPPADVRTIGEEFAHNYAPWRAGAVLLGAFAAIAVLLCGLGIVGAVSYAAAQRTRELGVRGALGARVADNVRLLARGGALPALAGAGAGLVAFAALQQVLASLLYGVAPRDPVTAVAAVALLLGAVTVASIVPARRAARVDPAVVLRAE